MLPNPLKLFFPANCLNCEKINNTDSPVCLYCQPEEILMASGRCLRCYEPVINCDNTTTICQLCRNNKEQLIATRYCWYYTNKTAALIKTMKAKPSKKLAVYLAAALLMAIKQDNYLKGVTAIITAPLSNESKSMRLFNQSTLMAQAISKELNIPVIRSALRKQDPSRLSNKKLSRVERLQTSKYIIGNRKIMAHKNILILDDIITTGATITGMAAALQADHKVTIKVLALAKTPQYYDT